MADVSDKENQQTASMIEDQGGWALAVRCDVTRVEDVKEALTKTDETFGRLDFAFNNAAIEPKKPAATADYDLEEWDRIIDIDLRGVFLCLKYEIPLMQGRCHREHIIGCRSDRYQRQPSVCSGRTWRDRPHPCGALDYASQNIRANAVCPGYIDTPMMDRFTGGTAEGWAKVISEEPIGRMGDRKRS